MPLLIDDEFNVSFKINGLSRALSNLKNKGYRLAANFEANGDHVEVHGLIGVDIIQYLKTLKMINCINGSA